MLNINGMNKYCQLSDSCTRADINGSYSRGTVDAGAVT